jgi:hypothetical protein
MITLIALSRLIAMEPTTKPRKDKSYETKNLPKPIPQFERDLRVSNNRSRPEPLRFSSYPREGVLPPLNLAVHAIWRAEHLRFRVVVPERVGL